MLATLRGPGLLLLVLLGPTIATAETVELRSGAVLVGDVRVEGGEIVVDARYPRVETVKLKRDEIAPESLFRVLERGTDTKDAAGRKGLGELAESLDLKAVAVAEYRAAAQLDAALAKEMEARITRLIEGIAADLLEDARQLLEEGRPRAAAMYLQSVVELHPGSAAAKEAAALIPKARQEAGKSVDVALKTVPEDQAEKTIAEVESHLSKADGAYRDVSGHEGSVRDQRAVERAIVHYEAAWEEAKRLPVAAANQTLALRIEGVRARAKSSLVQAYLTAGSIQLQRRSLHGAEEYCNKACELAPEGKQTHELHRLIIASKALYRGWGGGRAHQ